MLEKIEVAGDELEIEVKPITLIFKSSDLYDDVKYKERFPIDMEASIYHIERVKVLHANTLYFLEKAMPAAYKEFKNLPVEAIPYYINQSGAGMKHLAGRLDLTLKLMDMKVPIAWVYPEACLHPSVQVVLGDILIELTKSEE